MHYIPTMIQLITLVTFFTLPNHCVVLRFNSSMVGPSSTTSVETLALGLRPRQKGLKGTGQEECENEDSHSQVNFLFEELESQWTFEPSKSDFRGQKTSHWGVFYIIGKLLKCKCLKWVHMTCLDICNTSYGKKKGQGSNWQFDSRPQKVGNRPNFRACRWSAIHRWKTLDESYMFA